MKTFWNNYNWHLKNRLLWVGTLLFGLACWQLAIRPTLRLRREYKELQAGEALWQANTQKLEQLRAAATHTAPGPGGTNAAQPHGDQLPESEQIALLAQRYGVNVRKLPAAEQLGTPTLQLTYREYQLEGSFAGLARLLHEAEQQPGMHILSAVFKKQPNPVTRMPELILLLRTVRLVDNL